MRLLKVGLRFAFHVAAFDFLIFVAVAKLMSDLRNAHRLLDLAGLHAVNERGSVLIDGQLATAMHWLWADAALLVGVIGSTIIWIAVLFRRILRYRSFAPLES